MLSFILQQCLGPFTMLLLKVSSEMGLLRHWSNHIFGIRIFGNISAMRVVFFCKCLKFNIDFKNAKKKNKKKTDNSFFWDKTIWIGHVKLSLLRREYWSSAVNVLRNSLKIFHITKRDFFQLSCLHSDHKNMIKVLSLRLKVLEPVYNVAFWRVVWNGDVLDIYLTTFSRVLNLGNTSAIMVIFFPKCLKLNIDFKYVKNRWEPICCFWDSCIWIGWVKLSLLRREYLSSAVNMLINSLTVLHITKRTFFRLNSLHSDQKIW